MNKLDMAAKDIINDNTEKIKQLFPNVVVETSNGLAINFDALKQELSNIIIESSKEKYEMTWPGKKDCIALANKSTNKTLRPDKIKSVDFDNTENVYIEGDNLDVLKILQESYLNKIKCIYIDPPYNTGNDFVYDDDFKKNMVDENIESGIMDEYGNKLITNSESNGRFHSDWLSMMYPRLKLARNLLSEEGVIFISIDDHEVDNLKKICNEIFGEKNFLECLIWKKRATPPNDRNIGRIHEFILCYTKNIDKVKLGLLPRDEKSISRYSNPDNDERGPWVASDLSANGKGGRLVQSCVYPIKNPYNGEEYLPSEGRCWLFNEEKMTEWIKEGRVSFRENTGAPFLKRYLSEVRQGLTLPTIMTEFGFSQTSSAEADKLFGVKGVFEYAKPTTLIDALLRVGAPDSNDIILDFFSGSGTTAHSIFKLNTSDELKRKFILVQIPEKCDEKTVAYKNGYNTICDIAQDRIKKASAYVYDETNKQIDYGFRVYKVDSSNMKDIYYKPSEISQESLFDYISNIKEDRNSEDLLTQVILDLGLTLDLHIEERNILNNKIYFVANNALVACFDDKVNIDIIDEICKCNPLKVVFKDISFKTDKDKINLEERIKKLSPDTEISIL